MLLYLQAEATLKQQLLQGTEQEALITQLHSQVQSLNQQIKDAQHQVFVFSFLFVCLILFNRRNKLRLL